MNLTVQFEIHGHILFPMVDYDVENAHVKTNASFFQGRALEHYAP